VAEHSNCQNCEKDEGWAWLEGRSAPKKLCYTFDIVTRSGAHKVPFNCQYNGIKVHEQQCKVDFSGMSNKDKELSGKYF
jgi:hypothetical protein